MITCRVGDVRLLTLFWEPCLHRAVLHKSLSAAGSSARRLYALLQMPSQHPYSCASLCNRRSTYRQSPSKTCFKWWRNSPKLLSPNRPFAGLSENDILSLARSRLGIIQSLSLSTSASLQMVIRYHTRMATGQKTAHLLDALTVADTSQYRVWKSHSSSLPTSTSDQH